MVNLEVGQWTESRALGSFTIYLDAFYNKPIQIINLAKSIG